VINKEAVRFALRVALALHCSIATESVFARKNYFYPDLPKGFQISQYELPLARKGWLDIEGNEHQKRVRIRRVHLEEDTGKLFHQEDYSLIDFNRSGVPLLEIVSEPDLHSIEEVKRYAIALRSLLRYLEVNSGDMEKGVIRFEANVSVRKPDSEELGIRTEIKNLNSFHALVHAVEYEIARQSQLLSEGRSVTQETLGWDERNQITVSQRGKEEAHDYRYFPEPDLPPLHIQDAWIKEIRTALPELPQIKRQRFIDDLGLSPYAARVITAERQVAEFFEETVAADPSLPPEKIGNWLVSDLFALLNEAGLSIHQSKITPNSLAELVGLVERGDINITTAKTVLTEMFKSGSSPSSIVDAQGLSLISDPETIDQHVSQVLQSNPEQVEDYLMGKRTIRKWFFGQVMRLTQGRADPGVVQTRLALHLKRLEENHTGK
jgi:aspartyl-tRNA(Asn)/glutamyl-tRNA(Gln) amidotransferase subunit B